MVVANPGGLNSTEAAVRDRFINLSFFVILIDGSVAQPDTLNKEIVFISDTVNDGVGTTLCDIRAPIMAVKPSMYDELNMTNPPPDNGLEPNQTDIEIVDSGHPIAIASGLSGIVSVFNPSKNMGWGIPLAGAQSVASIASDLTKATLFAYSGGIACAPFPARRVAFPLPLPSGTLPEAMLTPDGWTLFDAAVLWAAVP